MKPLIITFYFLLIFFSAFSQSSVSDTVNQLDTLGRKQGYWIKYDEEGKKKYEGRFRDDIPVGKFHYYYEDGKLKAISVFSNKGQDNWTITLYRNGKKMTQGLYKNTIKDSVWKYYNENEVLVREETYKDGKKEGLWKTYYPDGSIDEEITWNTDQRNGSWIQYYSNGTLKLKATYLNGFLDGSCQIFDTEGLPYITGKYKKSQKDGPWIYFNSKGLQSKRETYVKDILVREEVFLMVEKILKPVEIQKIAYVYLKESKVYVRLTSGDIFKVDHTIAELDELLGIYEFVKINKTFIVNFKAVVKVTQKNETTLILDLDPPSEIPAIVEEEFKNPFLPYLKRNLE